MSDTKYNGWTNYATWNVALWLSNDEGLYHLSREYKHAGYRALVQALRDLGNLETPDGVAWNDRTIDVDELDSMLEDL